MRTGVRRHLADGDAALAIDLDHPDARPLVLPRDEDDVADRELALPSARATVAAEADVRLALVAEPTWSRRGVPATLVAHVCETVEGQWITVTGQQKDGERQCLSHLVAHEPRPVGPAAVGRDSHCVAGLAARRRRGGGGGEPETGGLGRDDLCDRLKELQQHRQRQHQPMGEGRRGRDGKGSDSAPHLKPLRFSAGRNRLRALHEPAPR